MAYKAFISYSHAADNKLAPTLQSALHRFCKPWYKLRTMKVFRDKTSLSASPALWPSIEKALGESEYFLFMASPDSAQSYWVQQEVEFWKEKKSTNTMLIILTDGELVWDSDKRCFDWDKTTAIPENLRNSFQEEPLYVDLRWVKAKEHISFRHPQFREVISDIAAPLLGKPKDELVGEDIRQHRKTLRMMWTAISVLVVLVIVAIMAAYLAINARNEAQRQTRNSTAGRLAAESSAIREELPQRKVLLAVEAMFATMKHGEPPITPAKQSLYDALSSSGGAILGGHDGSISSVAFSPDGIMIAAGDKKGIVRLWDVSSTSEPYLTLHGFQSVIYAMAISEDKRWLVTDGAKSNEFWIWDMNAQTKEPFKLSLPDFFVRQSGSIKIAISPNSRWLVTAGAGNVACVLDLFDIAKPPVILSDHDDIVGWIIISHDSRRLITASYFDSIVRVWNLDDLTEPSIPLSGHGSGVIGVKLSGFDSNFLVTVDRKQMIRLWDLRNLSDPLNVFHTQDGFFKSVAISPDGQKLIVATDDLSGYPIVRIWDLTAEDPATSYFDLHGPGDKVLELSITRDNKRLLIFGLDGIIRMWNLDRLHELPTQIRGHEGPIEDVAISHDGQRLVTSGINGTARLWDLAAPTVVPTILHRNAKYVSKLAIASKSQLLAVFDGVTRLWDIHDLTKPPLDFQMYKGGVMLSPNGCWLVTGIKYSDPDIRVWDLNADTPNTTASVPGVQEEHVGSEKFALSNERLFSVRDDNVVRIWELTDLDKLPIKFPLLEDVSTLAVSLDGRLLITAHKDKTIRIWDLTTGRQGKELYVLEGHKGVVHTLVVSPDSRWLMTWDTKKDSNIRIWDLTAKEPGKDPLILKKGYGTVFTPDSRMLISTDLDQHIRVLDLESDGPLETMTILRGHESKIKVFAISDDGKQFASGDEDGTVLIWDLHDLGTQLLTLKHEKGVSQLVFSPDGHWLVTADRTGSVLMWELVVDELISLAAQVAGRNLSAQEFGQYFPDQTCRKTFPNLSVPDNEYYKRVSGKRTSYNAVKIAD